MESQSATSPHLVRRSRGRMIAGVCSGIAEHFGIDPILVRIGFVIAVFFGGSGVLAYVAAWLLIPEEGRSSSIGERVLREHRWGRIAGFVLIAIAISSLARPVWWFGGHVLFAVLLIIGGLYLLSPGFARRDTPDDISAPQTNAYDPTAVSEPDAADDAVTQPYGTTLTAEYSEATPAPRRELRRTPRRGGIGALTFGLLFVGGGVVGLVAAAGHTIEPTYVFASGLLIVGAALVVSTWFGRSYVLIPLGVVLVGLMSVSTLIDVPITGGVGHQEVTPFAPGDIRGDYHLGIGELRLDLSHVPLDGGSVHTIKATVGIGHLMITLPRNATVELHGHSGMGDVRILGESDSGIRIDRDRTLSAGSESAPRLVLDAEVGIGQVEVLDAAA
jgi:phage shock protein PspC (stress-responsive transcriptional regulator)